MERFELARARDFKSTIIKYLEDQMAHQQQVRFVEYFYTIYRSISMLMCALVFQSNSK